MIRMERTYPTGSRTGKDKRRALTSETRLCGDSDGVQGRARRAINSQVISWFGGMALKDEMGRNLVTSTGRDAEAARFRGGFMLMTDELVNQYDIVMRDME